VFPIVPASGRVVEPYVFLHANNKKGYSPLPEKRLIKCYITKRGYMNRNTFSQIMKHVFVVHAENVRERYGLKAKQSVLVVDGHISRYSVRTIDLLIARNIHLLILPSHSSHEFQPA